MIFIVFLRKTEGIANLWLEYIKKCDNAQIQKNTVFATPLGPPLGGRCIKYEDFQCFVCSKITVREALVRPPLGRKDTGSTFSTFFVA